MGIESNTLRSLGYALAAFNKQEPSVVTVFMRMIENLENPFRGGIGNDIHRREKAEYYGMLADVRALIEVGDLAHTGSKFACAECELDSKMREAILFCTRVHNSFPNLD